MNSDISIMIDLQALWDRVLHAREDAERVKKSIRHWEETVAEGERAVASLEGRVRDLKASIKQKELELAEMDEKAKRLGDRKKLIKTEREAAAVESELASVNEARGVVEEEAIRLMDELESAGGLLESASGELRESSRRAESDIAMLRRRLEEFEEEIRQNTENFNTRLPGLSATVRSRFQRLISSGNGRAIARLSGEICGSCNTAIPMHVAAEASKSDRIVCCTNCGRFIYR